jgi:pimeloyl-ACP methyl ester carboxylesterase
MMLKGKATARRSTTTWAFLLLGASAVVTLFFRWLEMRRRYLAQRARRARCRMTVGPDWETPPPITAAACSPVRAHARPMSITCPEHRVRFIEELYHVPLDRCGGSALLVRIRLAADNDAAAAAHGERNSEAPPPPPPLPPTTTTTTTTTRGAVLFLHGFAQNHRSWHAAGHRSLLCFAAAAGFDVFALDMRSAACRALGAAPAQGTWQLATDDVPQALRVVAAVSAHRRTFVVGHSLGGLVACAAAGRHPELVAGVVPVAGAYHFGRAMRAPGQPGVVRALWRGGLAAFRAVFGSGLVPRRLLVPTRLLGRLGGVLGWAMSHALPGWLNLARLVPASLQISLPGAFPPGPEAALLRSFCAESFEDMPLGTANDLVAMASRTAAGEDGRSLMAFDGRPKPKPAPAPAAVGAAAAADSADPRTADAAGAAAPAAPAAAAAAAATSPAARSTAAGGGIGSRRCGTPSPTGSPCSRTSGAAAARPHPTGAP